MQFLDEVAPTLWLARAAMIFAGNREAPDKGMCILLAAWRAKTLDVEGPDDSTEKRTRIRAIASEFDTEIKSLKSLKATKDGFRPSAKLAEAVERAFNLPYDDPFHAKNHYIRQLIRYMEDWKKTPKEFIAPYTSLINASMMGKTRLAKEISTIIPTIYICARGQQEFPDGTLARDDGYPKKSPNALTNYLTREVHDLYDPTISIDTNLENIENHYFRLFVGIFQTLRVWTRNVDSATNLHDFRVELWLQLAQPETLPDERRKKQSGEFWKMATDFADAIADEERGDQKKLMKKLKFEWDYIKPFLSVEGYNPDGEPYPMLLIFWDEARELVKHKIRSNPQGDPNETRLENLFIMLRRVIRKIGRDPHPILPIFHVFTDTTSRISNFQPHGATDSARKEKDDNPARSAHLFPTMSVLPGLDMAAFKYFKDHKVTTRTAVTQRPERLLKFGRSAWSLYALENNEVEIRDLATQKLFGIHKNDLGSHFETKPIAKSDDQDRFKALEAQKTSFLACLGPRIAFQTGSYVTATSDLISSHMMPLEKVGADHHALVAHYMSEPVLAEVSAEATGNFGWEMPLRTLVSELRSGVVMKAFRGEFVTRILVIMAMEEAQQKKQRKNQARGIEATTKLLIEGKPLDPTAAWEFSQVVPVKYFLNALLQHPGQDESPDLGPSRKRPRLEPGDHGDDNHPQFSQFLLDEISSMETRSLKLELDTAMKKVGDRVEALGRLRKPDLDSADSKLLAWVTKVDALDELYKMAPSNAQKVGQFAKEFLEKGRVFFNHWILLDHPVRPSTLIKAWTRCAALVCKPNTTGIDFIIPVMMGESTINDEEQFGPLFGRWTVAQEKFADKFVSYILIQTKNRSGNHNIMEILKQCIPMTKDASDGPLVSFENPKAKNPYISILMDLGNPRGDNRVNFVPTTSVAEVAKENAELAKLNEAKEHSDTDAEAKLMAKISKINLNMCERSWQIAIAVHGLDGQGYRCLRNPKCTEYLEKVLHETVVPSDTAEDPVEGKLIRSGMHLTMSPEDEEELWAEARN